MCPQPYGHEQRTAPGSQYKPVPCCYGIEGFDTVHVKKNALALLGEALRTKRKKGVIGTGAMSDPCTTR